MTRIGDQLIFEDLPYILQDEFGFVLEDCMGVAGKDWNREAPRHVFKDDGHGYVVPSSSLLKENTSTYRVGVDGESFVWSYDQEQWLIIGVDL